MNTTIKGLLVGVLLSGWFPGTISVAQAATVSFMDIRTTDGNDATGFDVSASATEQTGDTTLTLGILPFSISAGGGTALMSDTLLMKVVVNEPGWRITSLTYTESGEFSAQTGFVAATIQMLANQQGPPAGPFYSANMFGSWGIGQNLAFGTIVTEVDVSLSNQLFAGGVAQIWKTAGKLEVGLEAIEAVPVPAAVWLFGSALVGFLAFSRRRLS
ncbi:MAG: hypothetical protein KDI47_01920 [Gammaproteobacteria bacterium]|nr:hypothetical protein [Gammaproteobacteria bacterium]MCB1902922.1 hypothetical protein [Gammaproteobacteria bacterium]